MKLKTFWRCNVEQSFYSLTMLVKHSIALRQVRECLFVSLYFVGNVAPWLEAEKNCGNWQSYQLWCTLCNCYNRNKNWSRTLSHGCYRLPEFTRQLSFSIAITTVVFWCYSTINSRPAKNSCITVAQVSFGIRLSFFSALFSPLTLYDELQDLSKIIFEKDASWFDYMFPVLKSSNLS